MLKLFLATSLAVGGCIGTRDGFLYVALTNADAMDYVVLIVELGSEDQPVAYQLASTGSGFIQRSGSWRGRIRLVDPVTCQEWDSMEIGPAGATATVQFGAFEGVADGPATPADLAELDETHRCPTPGLQ